MRLLNDGGGFFLVNYTDDILHLVLGLQITTKLGWDTSDHGTFRTCICRRDSSDHGAHGYIVRHLNPRRLLDTSVLVPKCPDTSDHGKVSQRHKAVTRRVHWSRESASQLDWLQRIQDGCCSASSNTCIHVCIPIRRRFPLQFANSYFANGPLSNAVRVVHTML